MIKDGNFTRSFGLLTAGATLAFSAACSSHEPAAPAQPTVTAVECSTAGALQAQADAENKTAAGTNNYNGMLQARAASAFYGALALAATEKCTTGNASTADKTLEEALAEARTARSARDYREITDDWIQATNLAELATQQLMAVAQTPTPSPHSSPSN